MREQEFREWLKAQGYTDGSIRAFAPDALRVEKNEKTNLDREFKEDKLESLIVFYSYDKQDELDPLKRPPNMIIKTKDPSKSKVESLRGYAAALKHYRSFCEDNPPNI